MKPEDIVFSGVGKTHAELRQGLEAGIGQFNIESEEEGYELAAIAARYGRRAACALRVNPDVDARTHEKISTGKRENKFGVPLDRATEIYARLAREEALDMRGIAVHIGSQLSTLEPLETAFAKLGKLIAELRAAGCSVTHADLGGGLGVPYKAGEELPSPAEYGAMVARVTAGWDVRLMFEPGRVIAGNAGVLLTRVIRSKRSGNGPPFVVVDAAMNDLARPAMYGALARFRGGRTHRRDDDRAYRRPDLRNRRYLRDGSRLRRAGGGRPRRVPHRRSLWRDDGLILQFARIRGGKRWSMATAMPWSPTGSRRARSWMPNACPHGSPDGSPLCIACRSSTGSAASGWS